MFYFLANNHYARRPQRRYATREHADDDVSNPGSVQLCAVFIYCFLIKKKLIVSFS